MLPAPKKSRQPAEVPHSCYQIDFAAVNCGKMIAASKRRIRFKFGYTNVEAISSGATGTDCRGSEHDVTITWSLSSGKQSVVLDGKEMYFDVGDTTKVKCTFKDKDEHTLQVMVHAAPLSTKSNPDPDWRQYDLLIDGISYFRYPRIYQLGVFPSDEAQKSTAFAPKEMLRIEAGPAYSNTNTNVESVLPKEEKKPEPVPVQVADLLSFDDSEIVVSPIPTNVYAVPASPSNNAAPAPTFMDYSSNEYSHNFASAPISSPYGNQYAHQMSPGHPEYEQQTSAPVTPHEMAHSNTLSKQNYQYSNYQMNGNPFDFQPNQNPSGTANSGMLTQPNVTAPPQTYAATPNSYSYDQGMPTQSHLTAPPQTHAATANSYSYDQGMPTQPQVTAPPQTYAATPNNYSYDQGMTTQPQVTAPPQTYAATPITPNCSSQALVPANDPATSYYAATEVSPANNIATTATGALQNLVNIDDLFGPSVASIAKQAPKPPAQQRGGQKKPVMNSFNPQPQGMYQQPQQQQGMYPSQSQMGYPQYGYQQQPYNNYQMQYPQQGFAQPGFQQPGY